MRLYTGQRNRLAWLFRPRALGEDNVILCDDKELEELNLAVRHQQDRIAGWPSSSNPARATEDADRKARLSRMSEALRWPS